MSTTTHTLKTGDTPAIGVRGMFSLFVCWSAGDGSGNVGYSVGDYFDENGRYLGPDQHGIEPLFRDQTDAETAEYLTSDEFLGFAK